MNPPDKGDSSSAPAARWLDLVREKIAGLRYGTVQLVIHDGRVMEIARAEKMLLAYRPTKNARAS